MARFSLNLNRILGFEDEEDDYEELRESTDTGNQTTSSVGMRRQSGGKVVPMNGARPTLNQIILYEPRMYSDVQEIATQLMKDQAAIVNFSRIEHDQAVRIVDFLTGTLYAIDGDIERIGNQIFLCTPSNYEVTGDISANFSDNFNKG